MHADRRVLEIPGVTLCQVQGCLNTILYPILKPIQNNIEGKQPLKHKILKMCDSLRIPEGDVQEK